MTKLENDSVIAGDRKFVEKLLRLGEVIALEAGALTLQHFGQVLEADSKGDGTPVTIADRAAERLLRERIRHTFPGHGILGEEFGEEEGPDPVRWILDPIDGTQAFMRGVPLYAVLIGVEVEGEAAVGVAHFPALGETVSAAAGLGCRWYMQGRESPEIARTSTIDSLAMAATLTTEAARADASPIGPGWRALCESSRITRGWGDAYGHALVATGRAEVMVDPVLAVWDAAPLLPIVREAGGRFTDLQGNETIHGGSGISTNGPLHADVLATLSGLR
jgi:histidinol-phosphatase